MFYKNPSFIHGFSAELRYKLYCTRTICTLIWDWFPTGHEITRSTLIHLKESEISITKHDFNLKVPRQKFYWAFKFSWANKYSPCDTGQSHLFKAEPRLSQPHGSTLPLPVALGLDQLWAFQIATWWLRKSQKFPLHPSLKWNHVVNMKVWLCYPLKMARTKMLIASNHLKQYIFGLDPS